MQASPIRKGVQAPTLQDVVITSITIECWYNHGAQTCWGEERTFTCGRDVFHDLSTAGAFFLEKQ
jgi:hypothetical protein